jgi:hypothetical protein
MILNKEIRISAKTKNKNYFLEKGYKIINQNYFIIKINDLKKNSHYSIKVKCDICGKEKELPYYKYIKNISNGNYYSCSQKCSRLKTENTNLKRFGYKIPLHNDKLKNKSIKTNIEKYGTKYSSQNQDIKNKSIKTNIKKYGFKCYLETNECREKLNIYFKKHKDDIITKRIKTNIKRYGFSFPPKNELIKEKIKKTNLKKYKTSCTLCNPLIKEKSRKSKINNLKNKFKLNIINVDFDNDIITIKCKKCNKNYNISYQQLIDRYSRKNLEICTICYPIGHYYKSNDEINVYNFIKENYKGKIITSSRKIIIPYELDIYLPNLNLAFEFNGLYWHSDLIKEKNYHLNKTELCEKKGIQLIHIFEDDWNYKKDIIKSIILEKLNKNKIINSIECKILELKNNEQIKNFLNNNHIHGFKDSYIKLGLFYKKELVSIMTFTKSDYKGKYYLNQFCNKNFINVKEYFSKLFNYFIKKYKPIEIISKIDRNYIDKNLLKSNMKFLFKTIPNFYYINKHNQKTINNNKTNKNYKIYDSGYLIFKLSHHFCNII